MKKILSWIMAIVAVVILVWVCHLLIESRDALKWPQTKGQVISSLLTIEHLPKFLDFGADPMRWYGAQVQYEYTVGGITYTSMRIDIQDSATRNPRSALQIMNKYRHHHEVMVFYNPANPQQAVLEPANMGDIYIPLLVGGLLVFLWFMTFFDQSVTTNPRGREDHLQLGNAYQRKGKLDEALIEYNKIIETSPYLAIGYVSRGDVYLEQCKWGRAIADFNKALGIDPLAAMVYVKRGQAYLGSNEYGKAWNDMEKAREMGIKIRPELLERIKKGKE